MAATTLNGVLLTGTHSARPAATAVAKGSLYACSTHGLLYQSDAATWSTWFDVAGGTSGAPTAAGRVFAYRNFNTAR